MAFFSTMSTRNLIQSTIPNNSAYFRKPNAYPSTFKNVYSSHTKA